MMNDETKTLDTVNGGENQNGQDSNINTPESIQTENNSPESTDNNLAGGLDSLNQQDDNKNEFFGKPDIYDYKDIQLPDGMSLNENMTAKFNDYASKLNLSQKGANDLMSMAVELAKTTREQTLNSVQEFQKQKYESYKQLLNSDKEIGGSNLKESLNIANIAYDEFFSDDELRNILRDGGLTVHPKFIKALKTIGSKMKDDNIFVGNNPSDNSVSREDILFPTMNEQ